MECWGFEPGAVGLNAAGSLSPLTASYKSKFKLVSDATSDMVSALESNFRSDETGAKSNFLSSEAGQQRVRSLSDSRSDGHKKQSRII